MKCRTGIILIFSIFLFACSTIKEAPLESTDPQEVLENIRSIKNELIDSNSDVLAKSSFDKGDKEMKTAIKALSKKRPRQEVLESLAKSKAYFLEAKKIAQNRMIVPENIMNTRNEVIEAGLSNKDLKIKLSKIDDSLIYESHNFTKPIKPEKLSLIQQKYQQIQIQSIQDSELGAYKEILKAAEKDNAKNLAPETLRDAKSKVLFAENLIGLNPKNPSYFMVSVDETRESVQLLDEVMLKLTKEAKGSTESTALSLVYQERQLGKLSDEVNVLQSSLSETSAEVDEMSDELADKEGQLANTQSKLRFQELMNEVRKSFNEEEANVYQQGDNLIIRLKKIAFKSGSATIPANSMSLLSKVNSVIIKLKPEEIEIEGHTDSAGPESINMMLSNKRAEAVKKYLSSLNAPYKVDARGYGESKPIANNQTKIGRALNRRVDIIVKANQK